MFSGLLFSMTVIATDSGSPSLGLPYVDRVYFTQAILEGPSVPCAAIEQFGGHFTFGWTGVSPLAKLGTCLNPATQSMTEATTATRAIKFRIFLSPPLFIDVKVYQRC